MAGSFDELFDRMRKLHLSVEQAKLLRQLSFQASCHNHPRYLPDGRVIPLEGLTDAELQGQLSLARINPSAAKAVFLKELQFEKDRRSLGGGSWPVGQGYWETERT